MIVAHDLEVGGARLRLLVERAALVLEGAAPPLPALLVADAHFGKAVAFRRQGLPVPRGTTAEMLAALDALIARHGVRRVVFLGDLMHSARARSSAAWDAVAAWRGRHAGVPMTLVRGNHDRGAGDPPPAWRLEVVDEPRVEGGLVFAHHPREQPGAYVIAGHLHPAVRLSGRARESLRLPCFHFGPRVGVLPSFGAFTGAHVVVPAPGDRVVVVAGDELRALPVAA